MSDSDSDSAAMAAAMGFSSFGGKPATKKRKFNATTDAFVEEEELEKIDRGGKKGGGSGGNNVPLGRMRVFGSGGGGGEKEEEQEGYGEIAAGGLDEDVDVRERENMRARDGSKSESDGPQYIDTSRTPPADEDDGPRYIDTSEPAPVAQITQDKLPIPPTNESAPVLEEENPASEAEALEMQRRIDALLQSIGSAPPPPGDDADIPPYGHPSHKMSNMRSPLLPPPRNLPNRSAVGASRMDGSGASFVQGRSRGGGMGGDSRGGNSARGSRNEKWWVDYYDPSFNRNPWEELERERGLGSVGTWLEQPKGQGRGGQRA